MGFEESRPKAAVFGLIYAGSLLGQSLAIDASANRHPISPDIYGVNDYSGGSQSLSAAMRPSVRRFGGDATTRYNWVFDNYNSGADYYFENYAYSSSATSYFDQMVATNHRTHTKTVGTIPILGWTTKSRAHTCSYSVAKYGKQDSVDPYSTDCGNGQLNKNWLANTDPHDTSVEVDQTFYAPWIAHLISTYGPPIREVWRSGASITSPSGGWRCITTSIRTRRIMTRC